ncbi:MFS transporter [Acidianus sulfidivorans JP7]|uniref:MFS transporter n=1 Tax=Acidianus sulfidivorans JP7 TaxID=619593 RepID=A0A2U9ILN5_9CREN|nr:MFS transporter [Acidianus sulfidivorans]AWR96968.1 MFS transporter [Acidianus sulfidivorans JP7]
MKEIDRLSLLGGIRSLGGSMVWPFIGFALYETYHFSFSFVSIFYIIQGIVGIFAYILGGYLTDLIGRIKVMILSSIFSSLALLMAFLINIPIIVVFFILIQTLFNSIYNVGNTSIVGDLNREFTNLVKSFSKIRVGINAGWSIGPVIGGFLFSTLGFRDILLVASLLSLLSIPLLFNFVEFKGKIEVSLQLNRNMIKFLIPTFFTFMIMGQLGFSLLTYYNLVDKFTTFQVSLLFMINGLLIVAFQNMIGKKLTSKMLIPGMALYTIGYFSIAFITNYLWACIDIGIITLAEMIVSPLSQAIASALSNKDTRGRTIGIYSMITALGRTAGSSFSSYLMNFLLYSPIYLWGAIATSGIISIIFYYIFGIYAQKLS